MYYSVWYCWLFSRGDAIAFDDDDDIVVGFSITPPAVNYVHPPFQKKYLFLSGLVHLG
jgi:hypothetical protein